MCSPAPPTARGVGVGLTSCVSLTRQQRLLTALLGFELGPSALLRYQEVSSLGKGRTRGHCLVGVTGVGCGQ